MLPTKVLTTTARPASRVADVDAEVAGPVLRDEPAGGLTTQPAGHAAAGYQPAQAAAATRLLSSSAVPMPAPGTVQRRGPTIPSWTSTECHSPVEGVTQDIAATAAAETGEPALPTPATDTSVEAEVTDARTTATDPTTSATEPTEPAVPAEPAGEVTDGTRRYLGGGVVSVPAVEDSARRRDAERSSRVASRDVEPLTSQPVRPVDALAATDAERQVAGVEAELDALAPVEGAESQHPEAEKPPRPGSVPAEGAEVPAAAEALEPGTEGEAGDDIAAWQGRVQTAAATMQHPQTAPAGTYSQPIEAVGGAGTQALQKKAEEIPLEAKKVLEAKPLKPLPEAPGVPAPDPVPRATQRLKELAVRKLPDQKLPKLIATPHGILPTVGGPPVDTKVPPTPPAAPKTKPGLRSKTPVKAVNDTLAEGPPVPVPGEGQTVTGSERPPAHAIAAPHHADIAKVLARVYMQAQGMGAEVMKDARATAYEKNLNNVDGLKDLGKEQEEQETVWFRQELGRVADAASIGKAALDAAVVERAKELEKGNEAHATEVATAAQEQVAKATEAGSRAQSAAEATYQAWEQHFDSMAAQAKGDVDPTAIRAEQNRISEELRSFANTHTTAWGGMRKIRERDLNRAGQDQYTAYKEAALADQAQLEKPAPPKTPPSKTEPAKALVTEVTEPALKRWLDERGVEVGQAVLALRTDLGKTVDGWTTDMNKARDEGVEAARVWADGRIGRERGWLETLIADWLKSLITKQQDNKALEQAQTDETVAALGGTLQVINDLKLGGMEKLDRDGKELLAQMTDEEKQLLQAYFAETGEAKGDTVLLLASLLAIRLRRQRRTGAQQYIHEKVLALDNLTYWVELNAIGAAQRPGFNAENIADRLYEAFEYTWGTDEEKAFAQVKGGLTLEQGKAVRGAYKANHGEDLDERMKSELDDTDLQRVQYGLDGQQAEADAAALAESMGHIFDADQTLIRETLRNKTEAQRKAIADAYKRLYGKDLVVDFALNAHGDDGAIVDALWAGNKEKADAIEIKVAREGFWGPDHEKVEQVYTRVRDEATKDGDDKHWTTAQVNAEIARRTGKMATEYAGYTKRGLLADLEKSFNPPTDQIWDPVQREAAKQYWAGRRDLVMGMATGDLTRADAGKIQIERTGFYAKDETVNKVLALQYSRAYDNARRDLIAKFAADHDGHGPNKEEMAALEKDAEEKAKTEGPASMGRLASYFETHYTGGTESFRDTIIDLTQGVDEEKATTLVDKGGFLEDWQVLEYATKGAGTDEDEFKRVLKKQRTKEQQDKLQSIWQEKTHTTQTIAELIDDETSGRLKNDLLVDNEFGGDPDDPAVIVAKAKEQLDFERRSGGESTYTDPETGEEYTVKSHEYLVLEKRLQRLEAAAAACAETKDLLPGDPRKLWAQDRLDMGVEGFASGIELNRFMVDQRTEVVAQVVTMAVTILVAAVITIGTAGTGAAPSVALVAFVSSLFGAAAGMAAKASMKGDAYGADEIATDAVLGAVDVAVSTFTAGFGGKLLKGATATAKAAGATGKGLVVTLGRMAEGTTLKRAAAHAITEGVEGFLQSLPTAVLGTAINEKTWTEGNPLFNMLTGVGMGVGMGTFASGTIGGLTNLRGAKAVHVPEPGDIPAIQGRLVDLVPGTAEHAHLEARYFELNPNRTPADFQRDLDGLVMLQAKYNPEVKTRLDSRLRDNISDLLPAGQKSLVTDHPIEMWDPKRFEEFTGSDTGHAVVIIKDGQPTVIVKQGADPHELAQEGFHLLQTLDPKTRPKVARLDESVMSRWSSLDVREKLELYKEKLDLELDAQRQVVAALEERVGAGRALDDPDLVRRLARAKETLGNLNKRAGDVARLGPLQRQLLAWGVLQPPPWLDQPARLFAKSPPPSPTRPKRAAKVPDGDELASAAPAKPVRDAAERAAAAERQRIEAEIQRLWKQHAKETQNARKQIESEIEQLWKQRDKEALSSMSENRKASTTETEFRRQAALERDNLDRLARMKAEEDLHEEEWLDRRLRDARDAKKYRELLEFGPDGPRFKEAAEEIKYQQYVAGKNREKLVPRVREEWMVAREYWAKEHPTARGNRFNEKRRGVYTFDEVAVVNPKNVAAGKRVEGVGDLRVDSYDIHPTDPSKNKIISRKATDLDAVDEATIVHYLDELRQKYPPGALITSWKEASGIKLRGQKLQGELYLELPSANLRPELDPVRSRYEALAKSKGITIIYADE